MGRTLIPVTKISNEGVPFEFNLEADSADGMEFVNTHNEILLIDNTDTVDHDIVIDYVADEYGRDGQDTISVVAGTKAAVGRFNPELYNHPEHKVNLNFPDAPIGLFVSVIRI